MSDRELVRRLRQLVADERRVTAAVLMHLAEVDARELYKPAACSSMHVYCTRVLGMSDDEAFKRIRAARALRRYPVVGAAVAEGRLHLTAVVLLAPHLTDESAAELVAEASGKSKTEIEILLARRRPRPNVAARLERVGEQAALIAGGGSAGGQVVPEPAPVAALSPERFALQLTIDDATRQKLLRAQALLRHQVPSGDLAAVLERALEALIETIERKRFGKTAAPRRARPSRAKRTIPREARRQAVARDGLRCSFVSEDGRRCDETGFLELDHVVPVALGGGARDGVRVLCRSHNLYEAERILGSRHRRRARGGLADEVGQGGEGGEGQAVADGGEAEGEPAERGGAGAGQAGGRGAALPVGAEPGRDREQAEAHGQVEAGSREGDGERGEESTDQGDPAHGSTLPGAVQGGQFWSIPPP